MKILSPSKINALKPTKGRKSNINVEKIKSLKDEGMGATAIARELGDS